MNKISCTQIFSPKNKSFPYVTAASLLFAICIIGLFSNQQYIGVNTITGSTILVGGTISALIAIRYQTKEIRKIHFQRSLCQYSPFAQKDSLGDVLRRALVQVKAYQTLDNVPPRINFVMGVMMGGAVGDALGSVLEFFPQKKKGYVLPGQSLTMDVNRITGADVDMTRNMKRFKLHPGQWTDDTAMALCLADSLLKNQGALIGTDLMEHFLKWHDQGLNNGSRLHPHHTIDVGTQIKKSLISYKSQKKGLKKGPYQSQGNKHLSGNGSLMRLGPVAYAKTLEQAMHLAKEQSETTHSGTEATDCAQLMAAVIFSLLDPSLSLEKPSVRKQFVLSSMSIHAEKLCPTVQALAKQKSAPNAAQPQQEENWNWMSEDFDYHPSRREGSLSGGYAMDALAMAFHCVWTTETFRDAVVKAALMGGDADTVAAITGQIAGALYGYSAIPKEWRDAVHQHDGRGEIPARALALDAMFGTRKE